MSKKGRLEMIVGCMSSSKTDDLISRIDRVGWKKRKAIVFQPEIDTRNNDAIASRNGKKIEAVIKVSIATDILKHVEEGHYAVGIDEAQFFDHSLIGAVNKLIDLGKRVIVSGLDTDFRGEPFGVMPQLLALADSVKKRFAVCMVCGNNAMRTQRLIDGKPAPYDSPLIQVGGDELYEARCRSCHEVPKNTGEDWDWEVYQ